MCDANLQSNHKMPEDGFATCSGFSTVISIFLEFCPWVTCTKHITPAKCYYHNQFGKEVPKVLLVMSKMGQFSNPTSLKESDNT